MLVRSCILSLLTVTSMLRRYLEFCLLVIKEGLILLLLQKLFVASDDVLSIESGLAFFLLEKVLACVCLQRLDSSETHTSIVWRELCLITTSRW